MLEKWLAPLLILLLTAVIGCGGEESGADGNNPDSKGQTAAVEPGHWGKERVVYAEDMDWVDEQDVPAGEEWATPPSGQRYVKFTYNGPKLTRLETFGAGGRPARRMMVELTNEYSYGENGLAIDRTLARSGRTDWAYAAHGGVVEQSWYADDGETVVRHTCRYDDANRLVEKILHDGEQVTERQTYRYDEQGREVETVYLAPDGSVRARFQNTYSDDGKRRTEKMEVYQDGTVVAVGTFSAHWDPVVEEWWTASRTWEEVE